MILKQHYDKSIYLIREARAKYKNLGLFWAGGKDSTLMLYLTKEALYGKLPKVFFLNTTYAFSETKEFLRLVQGIWNFKVIHLMNREALSKGMDPWNNDTFECCAKLKTFMIIDCVEKYNMDALMFGIRWDEHPIRGKETYYSFRDTPEHMRIHPILHWSEENVWRFTKHYNIPYNSLYDRIVDGKRYTSLGCYPCTVPISKEEHLELGERGGRTIDKKKRMERARALGYC